MNTHYIKSSDLTDQEFLLFQKYVYDKVGIDVEDHKKGLLRNRLKKRLKALGISSYRAYYEFLRRNNDDELGYFISAVTTNVTSFFREPKQWAFLKDNLRGYIEQKGDERLNIWSAGCASGEEPYTISIFLRELLGTRYDFGKISILATDISEKALGKAKTGKYLRSSITGLSSGQLSTYFIKEIENGETVYSVADFVRESIRFKLFNLVYGNFMCVSPVKDFDMVFCRNVMIYFDQAVRNALIDKFISRLAKGGYLLVGHSESLTEFNGQLNFHGYGIYSKK